MRHTMRPAAFDPQQEMRTPQVEIRYCLDEDSPTVDIHSHSHYELYLFCEGDLDRYVVGSRSYRLQRGDLLLIPPKVTHHPIFLEGARHYQRYVLWCSQDYLTHLTKLDGDIDYAFRLCRERGEYLLRFPLPSVSQMLENELRTMWTEFQSRSLCRETAIQLSCMSFLVRLNRSVSTDAVVSSIRDAENPLLEQVITYIHEHYGEPLSLQDTAKKFFVSPSTIEHQFTQKLGWSFYRYVTKRRIIEARNQIAAGVPLKAACQNCGYADYSNFYKAFTREVGMTPSQFRRFGQHQVLETLIE